MARNKRRQLVVDRRFQLRFVGSFLLSVLVSLVIFTLVVGLYYWFSNMAGENLFKEFITIDRQVIEERIIIEEGVERVVKVPGTKTILGIKRWELVLPAILLNNLIIMIIMIIFGIRYSHRIAGPAFRINSDIDKVLQGSKGIQIKLREKDRLREVAFRVNKLIRRLEEAEKEVS
ncbi:hypothetical protein [Marispirochaeta aestuarii]|uniref:hypothetical protein n=1 Tax=Marispirochaeta aestuarii TaxID=1963862 RepID=UPI002ABE73F0|nr:hypothetical protein [Marispirochaeta aestuarii]